MEREWRRQKEARVIGRRGRTSEGEHLLCTEYESRGGPPPRSCRRCSPWTKKDRAEKGASWVPNDVDNEYLCMPRWDKFHGTARYDREKIGPVKEDTPRDTIRGVRARESRLPNRCFRRCVSTEIIVRSSSSSPPLVAAFVAFASSCFAKFGFTFAQSAPDGVILRTAPW